MRTKCIIFGEALKKLGAKNKQNLFKYYSKEQDKAVKSLVFASADIMSALDYLLRLKL